MGYWEEPPEGASSSVGHGVSSVWSLLGMGHGVQGRFGFPAWAASVTKAGDNPGLHRPGLGAVRWGWQTWGQDAHRPPSLWWVGLQHCGLKQLESRPVEELEASEPTTWAVL